MNWTKEKPTKPDFYGLRKYRFQGHDAINLEPVIVLIYKNYSFTPDEYTIEVAFHGSDMDRELDEIVEGEWCGPIELPE